MSAPASRADWAARGRGFAARAPSPVGRDEARLRAFAAARRHSRLVRFLRVAAPASVVPRRGGVDRRRGLRSVPREDQRIVGRRIQRRRLQDHHGPAEADRLPSRRTRLCRERRQGDSGRDATRPSSSCARSTAIWAWGTDGSLHIAAAVGFYDTVRQSLDLSQDVRIHNSNYDVRLASANIDFKAGVYRSDAAGDASSWPTAATISADSAVARDNGEELTFSGHVRSMFVPEAGAPPAPAEMKGTNP